MYRESIAAFQKALEFSGGNPIALGDLGHAYAISGQPQKARGEYSYALELRKDYFLPLIGLARMYRDRGDRARALEHSRRGLELRPADVEAHFLYGQLLYEDGKLDEAYGELKKVVATVPRHLAARRTLVLIHAARGAGEELAQELEGIVALSPADLDALRELVLRISRLATDVPEVIELDLNPVIALPAGRGCRVVDARVRVRGRAHP